MPATSKQKQPIGLIGTGLMGTAMGELLLGAGYPLVVHNRTRRNADALIALGARWSENPLEECDRVFVCLYTTANVESMLRKFEDALVPGKFIIDSTTGDPQRMSWLGENLAERGVEYLEVPISGSSEQTRRHMSTALAAGPEDAFAACADLFDCVAAKTYYVGEWGNGVRMKLVTNLVLGLNRAVLAEGLVFAKTIGLSMDRALEVLMNSPAYSKTMDAKGPKMVAGEFSPQAKLSQHIKDVELILSEASLGGKTLPLSQLHLALLEQAENDGLGELDNSSIINVINDSVTPSLSTAELRLAEGS